MDKWLPSLPLGHPTPLGPVSVSPNLRVDSLIFPVSRHWDLEFLLPFLSVSDQQVILSTPIGAQHLPDRVVWEYCKNGSYSVRSGYQWLCSRSLLGGDCRRAAAQLVSKTLWKMIWRVDVPPKLCYFLWMSFHNCIPTCAVLFSRRFISSPQCPICTGLDESLEHLLLFCPWVSLVWFGSALSYRVNSGGICSWDQWLAKVLTSFSSPGVDKVWF